MKFIRQVIDELGRVTWPSRKTAIEMSAIVIAVSVVVGLYIGGLDAAFTAVVDLLVAR